MTIEEKAKRYDEAIERAKKQLDGAKVFDYEDEQIAHDIRTTTYDIFPELKESEDERIREFFINFAEHYVFYNHEGFTKNDAIAWLEKHSSSQTKE